MEATDESELKLVLAVYLFDVHGVFWSPLHDFYRFN
jgi:hypothetical protein